MVQLHWNGCIVTSSFKTAYVWFVGELQRSDLVRCRYTWSTHSASSADILSVHSIYSSVLGWCRHDQKQRTDILQLDLWYIILFKCCVTTFSRNTTYYRRRAFSSVQRTQYNQLYCVCWARLKVPRMLIVYHFLRFLPHDAMHSADYPITKNACPSVRLSVRYTVKTARHILKLLSSISSHTTVAFPLHTKRQDNVLTGMSHTTVG